MRKAGTWLAGVFGLCVAATAAAHDPLPDVQWCSTGRVVPVAGFVFTPAQVQAYADCLRHGTCFTGPSTSAARGSGGSGGCDVQHCGQFDDDYGAARRMANGTCQAYARDWAPGHVADWGSVVEVIATPVVYNGLAHHEDYHATLGLTGQCARCEDPLPVGGPLQINRN